MSDYICVSCNANLSSIHAPFGIFAGKIYCMPCLRENKEWIIENSKCSKCDGSLFDSYKESGNNYLCYNCLNPSQRRAELPVWLKNALLILSIPFLLIGATIFGIYSALYDMVNDWRKNGKGSV